MSFSRQLKPNPTKPGANESSYYWAHIDILIALESSKLRPRLEGNPQITLLLLTGFTPIAINNRVSRALSVTSQALALDQSRSTLAGNHSCSRAASGPLSRTVPLSKRPLYPRRFVLRIESLFARDPDAAVSPSLSLRVCRG